MDNWQQGKFGNPIAFQPKENILRQMCLEFLPQAFGVIKEVTLNGEEEKNRLAAARFVAEQAGGKAPQSIEIRTSDGMSPSMMTPEQLNLYASGRTQELILNLHRTGQLEKYLNPNQLSLEAPSIESTEGK